ncbi:glycoside hydrolase family 43 protein [Pedobacter sp. AW31-3R]|uniref:glycoside hydrolase family 43 protein n=1 Tax=Pedobacter sp. AW31-3R TaxID=3445781 RepID=UPI003FA0E4AC
MFKKVNKLTTITFLLFLLSIPCLKAQSKNGPYLFAYFKGNGEDGLHYAYSHDGYQWKALKDDRPFLTPTVSKDKLMRDPCIIRGADGRFHMVWTVSWNDKGIGYASSTDLIHWTEQQFIPVMAGEKEARNSWAPEITYDPVSKIYMIYWATTINGKFTETAASGDDGYNNRLYQVTTKDFKTFTETRLLFDPGYNVIDATIVKEGKRFIMFFKDETRKPAAKNLKIAYSEAITGPYLSSEPPFTGKYWAEGPTTLKINDTWLVYFDKYTEKKYGALASGDLKTWTDQSDRISLPKGIRHGTILKISARELKKLQEEK